MHHDSLYIIGDVHGCFNTLLALIDTLPQNDKATFIFVGDVIDRGAYSAHILDWIIHNGHTCLMGNHEAMMLETLTHPSDATLMDLWKRNGGEETLKSYKDFETSTLTHHLDWIRSLPNYFESSITDENQKSLFVTHGFGLPYWQGRDKHENQVRFRVNRLHKISDSPSVQHHYRYEPNYLEYPIFNVFGHDAFQETILTQSYAAIDTGCVYASFPTNKEVGGRLSALEWPSKRIYSHPYVE